MNALRTKSTASVSTWPLNFVYSKGIPQVVITRMRMPRRAETQAGVPVTRQLLSSDLNQNYNVSKKINKAP